MKISVNYSALGPASSPLGEKSQQNVLVINQKFRMKVVYDEIGGSSLRSLNPPCHEVGNPVLLEFGKTLDDEDKQSHRKYGSIHHSGW